MGDESTRITQIELPDGTVVWAHISGAEELDARPGGGLYTDTGFTERVHAQVESLNGLVTGVARSLADGLRAVGPDQVSVEFGIELAAKGGHLVGMLAGGEAKGAIKVTLTWDGGPPEIPPPPGVPPRPTSPPSPAAPGAPPEGAPRGASAHPDEGTPPVGSGA